MTENDIYKTLSDLISDSYDWLSDEAGRHFNEIEALMKKMMEDE